MGGVSQKIPLWLEGCRVTPGGVSLISIFLLATPPPAGTPLARGELGSRPEQKILLTTISFYPPNIYDIIIPKDEGIYIWIFNRNDGVAHDGGCVAYNPGNRYVNHTNG